MEHDLDIQLRHLLDELAIADHHVARAREHVARQEDMVAWRQSTGKDSVMSRSLLQTLKEVLQSHEQHRERLMHALTR